MNCIAREELEWLVKLYCKIGIVLQLRRLGGLELYYKRRKIVLQYRGVREKKLYCNTPLCIVS